MLTRDQSFFGMHFDFHAGVGQKNIGEFCDRKTIGEMLDAVKPDFVQCDTKGHVGATSYPTKVGYPAPEMKGDILRMWRDETAARGIALYAHHSGVWDGSAVTHHPDWAIVDADGKPSDHITSVFGPYVDELLIPQLKEIALDYKLDGAWIDGECWATAVDYSKWATDEYERRFGELPPKPDSPDYSKYLAFCRQGFEDYVAKYVNALHEAAPGFQITSNWMYTSFLPEEPVVPTDFISGDYSPSDSLNTARFEGRCVQDQGRCWDLMSWGFTIDHASCVKELPQLEQEAAAVIELGGAFQFYNRQLVGTIQAWPIPMWAELAKFCRERRELCWKSKSLPQAAIVFSERAFYKDKKSLFTPYGSAYVDELRGTLFACLDSGISTEVVMSHTMEAMTDGELDRYGVIILSNLTAFEGELKDKLLDYASRGGNLLIAGCDSAALFLPYLDVDITGGDAVKASATYLKRKGKFAPLVTPHCTVKLTGAEAIGWCADDDSGTAEEKIAASVTKYGNGRIAGMYFNTGAYANFKTAVARDFVGDVLRGLFRPYAEVTSTKLCEVGIAEKDGKKIINLLNLAGSHSDGKYHSVDEIPPLYGVGVVIRGEKPEKLIWQPEGKELEFEYKDGETRTVVPKLEIHGMIEVR
jgi:hypothetical protein